MGSPSQHAPKPQSQFKLVMRGYHPHEVEAFLADLDRDPDMRVPSFARTLRGYDPEQVDLHIQRLKALRRRPE